MGHCRLLPFHFADGPRQMAADETLLESAVHGHASLRFYAWSETTVSLGYFQPESSRQQNPRLASLPFVRRPSGGAALVHHHELTYALALPAGSVWQGTEPWLRRMHRIIADALAELGVAVHQIAEKGECRCGGSALCFQQLTPGDLRIGEAKVVGSAQRKQRQALLQHGGILLAASPFAPELPGIRELTGQEVSMVDLGTVIGKQFGRHTGWQLSPDDWLPDEPRRIDERVAERYSRAEWNCKR